MTASRRFAALIAATLIVTACGGGGTSPSPVASDPPAPSPSSPASVAPSDDPLSGADLDALVAAATAEGKVVVYSFTSRIAKVEEAFEAAYPAIDLVGNDISSMATAGRRADRTATGPLGQAPMRSLLAWPVGQYAIPGHGPTDHSKGTEPVITRSQALPRDHIRRSSQSSTP